MRQRYITKSQTPQHLMNSYVGEIDGRIGIESSEATKVKNARRFVQEQYEMQLFASGRKGIKIIERNEHGRSISQ